MNGAHSRFAEFLTLLVLLAIFGAGCGKSLTRPPTELSLPEVNRGLQMWAMSGKPYPANLNELTNIPCFKGKQLPSPPPGKKLALDPAGHVVFVD